MNQLGKAEALELFRLGNDSGRGYAPDAHDVAEVIADLINNYEGVVLLERHHSDEVAVVRCGDGEMVAIGGDSLNRNAWCVKIAPKGEVSE